MRKAFVLLVLFVLQATSMPIEVIAQDLNHVDFVEESGGLGELLTDMATASGLLFSENEHKSELSISPSIVPSDSAGQMIHELSHNKEAVLSAQTRKEMIIRRLQKAHFQANELISIKIDNPELQSNVTTRLIGPDGAEVNVKVEKKKIDDAMYVSVLPPVHFRPGAYRLVVEDATTGQKTEQDFTWGVLAINTNKSVYQPDERAFIAIGVLDEKGKMVCDADVKLRITNKELNIDDVLTTDNGRIRINPECVSKDFTLIPDYESAYEVGGEGVYVMELSAVHSNGSYAISDTFEVSNNVPFAIERTTATRIYPAHKYPVTITVTANEDFQGTIVETVPESFGISQAEDGVPFDDVSVVPAGIQPTNAALSTMDNLPLPFKGNRKLTSGFGEKVTDPLLQQKYEEFHLLGHDGIDFDMPVGTDVLTVDDGEVVLADDDHDYGVTMVVQHSWGKSYYGHLSTMFKQKGEKVTKGEKIALSGNSGLSTDAHLHFGIKLNDHNMRNGFYGKVDPSSILGITEVDEMKAARSEFSEQVKQIAWEVTLKKGDSMDLSYQYQASYISPQFYTLGPARMFRNNDLLYGEARSWQIAVDDTANYTVTDGSFTAATVSGACDSSLTNTTVTDGAQGTVFYSRCVGRSDTPVVKWTKTLTWEAMGIPAGSTITQVDGSYKYRVSSETHTATQAIGALQLQNSGDTASCAASDLEASFDPGAVNANYTTRNSSGAINVSAGCQSSSTSVTIRLNMSPVTGNNANATSELRADDIQFSITYTPPQPTLTQIHSRWRNDDGSETTATWRRSEDVAATAAVDALRRIRIEVSNEGAATATGTTYRIEYGLKASTCGAIGTWTAVPTTSGSAFIMADSSNLTDGESTTNVSGGLTDENTTFVAGQGKDTGNTTAGISLTTSQFTELEYSLKPTVNAAVNSTYCFRVTNAGSTTNFTYSQYPELTVGEPNIVQSHYRWRNDDGGEATLSNQSVILHPRTQGNYTGWSATGCTDNTSEWDCINDVNQTVGSPDADDGNSTHLTTTTTNARSSFGLPPAVTFFPASALVTQLQIFIVGAEVSNAGGDATVTAFYRLNSTDVDCSAGANAFAGTTYTTQSCTFTGLSLTQQDVDNLEIGILFGSNDPSVTKMYVTITYDSVGATWKQNEDTAHTGQAVSQNLRLRTLVTNTGDIAATRNLLLEYAEQTGGSCGDEVFTSVPVASGSPFEMTSSNFVNDGETTTAQLTSPGGTFALGEIVEDPSNAPGGISIGASNGYIEIEYVLQAATSAGGKTYCFRVTDNGSALDTYSVYPVLSVSVSGPTLAQLMRNGKWFNSGAEQPFTF